MEVATEIHPRVDFPEELPKIELPLSDIQKALFDAAPDCIKIISLDGRLLTMNRAGCLALGVPENSQFGMEWLPLLPEDVRASGTEALRDAASGRNARFPGKSVSTDGMRYWDNMLTPVTDASGRIHSIICISRDVTAKTLLENRLEEAVEREKLLSGEMQHRIKNLLAIVSGLIVIAGKEADTTNTVTAIFRDKLGALSRASDAAFSQPNPDGSNDDIADFDSVVRSVLQPYGNRCSISGVAGSIQGSSMTSFALFLYELATNSMKYGALSTGDGSVAVCWTVRDDTLNLSWIEAGGPAIAGAPERQGFGSRMLDRGIKALGGTIARTWRAEGLIVELRLPGFIRS